MTAFDPKDYEQRVVRPLRGRKPPDDLLTRYEVHLGLSDAEVAARVAEVRSHWNKAANSTAKSQFLRSVYNAFLREDEQLHAEHGDEMLQISWWRQREAARTRDRKRQVDELVALLEREYGDLGMIVPGPLEAVRDAFGNVAQQDFEEARTGAGIDLVEPCELPAGSGLTDTLYERLKSLLADAEVSSVPELLHGPLTSLRLLNGFGATPRAPSGLTAEAVGQAIDREDRLSGNRAVREALGILNTAVTTGGVDLRELALFHLLDDVRRYRDNRAPVSVLLRRLLAAKLDEAEARHAVASVLGEPTGSAPDSRPTVGGLLENGLLRAAERTLAEFDDPDAAREARKLVERQAAQVQELRDAAHRALAEDSEAAALRRLRQAVRLAADDEGLTAELRRIPLPPVQEISAHPEGLGVRVAWRAPIEHEDDTRYRVLRRTDRAPADADDGEIVGEVTETVLQDTAAPAGIALRYAVVAVTPGGSWSRQAGTEVEILPPVHGTQLKSGRTGTEANWEVHPDVVAVEVRRIDDSGESAIAGTGTTSFQDGPGPCTYVLRARYRRPDGSEVAAEEVRIESTRRTARTLPPVTGLLYRRFADEVVLSWTWPEQARIAEVAWSSGQGSEVRRTSRQEYQDAGGFRFRPGSGDVRVRVHAVGEDARSPATEVHIAERAPRIDYTIRRRVRPLIGGGTARITLTPDQPVAACAVLVVAAPGRVMPTKPEHGTVLRHLELEFPAAEPVEATVALPKLRRPYWLRCFTDPGTGSGDVRLVDPSTTQLKAT